MDIAGDGNDHGLVEAMYVTGGTPSTPDTSGEPLEGDIMPRGDSQ